MGKIFKENGKKLFEITGGADEIVELAVGKTIKEKT